jgi:hypothetical protein
MTHSQSRPARGLLLPHDVHFCITDNGGVFLDLVRDRYFGVALDQAPILESLLTKLPTAIPCAERAFIEELERSGLLTSDCTRGHAWSPVGLPVAQRTLMEQWTDERPRIKLSYIVAFVMAYVAAALTLRRGTRHAVSRVRRRNHRLAAGAARLDVSAAVHLLSVFLYLRPLLFTAHDHCLLDSMVLLEFLARHGIYANWVFGVKLAPFSAHCWVQHDTYIFNGRPESVGAYTRLMVA